MSKYRGAGNRLWLTHSARTATAAMTSAAVGRMLGWPESYWAPVTTLIVMQSTVGAAFEISLKRLAGTALGCGMGVMLAPYFGANLFAFGGAVFAIGLACATLRLDRAAYRFGGITLAIMMLAVKSQPAWLAGTHRFFEVSAGSAVALLLAALWPEQERL